MGCTPSTNGNGTSRTPDAGSGVGSKVAVFTGSHHEKGSIEENSSATLTCPSISDHPDGGQDVLCGRLFSFTCCRHCHQPSSRMSQSHGGHRRISASLTGLHSESILEPESTALASQSGVCSPKPQLSLRSSCASLCSICQQGAPTEASYAAGQAVYQSATANHNCKKASRETHHAAAAAAASLTKHNLSAIGCQKQLAEGNSGYSSDNKGEKKRKTQTKLKLSESFTPLNATLNSKESACCLKHQHRYYRQSASHDCRTPCPHKCCFTQLSSIANTVNFENLLQPEATCQPSPLAATNASSMIHAPNSKTKSMEKAGNAQFNSSTAKHWSSQSVKLGRMKIENKNAKALLVFNNNSQADSHSAECSAALASTAKRVGFEVTIATSADQALNAFVELQPEIIIIDARHLPTTKSQHSSGEAFDPLMTCKDIRSVKGSEFSCILAFVSRSQLEQENGDVATLLQSGFNRCLQETCNLSLQFNELIQLRDYELVVQRRLRAASALLAAVDNCKDGVVITGPKHDIQFANNSIEKIFGFRVEDIIGKNAQDYFQSDLIKENIDEKINNFNNGKEWEGQIYHRRKSGDSVPIWNRILPVNYHNGSPEFIIYIKEFPFLFIEKLLSPETESSLTYGSLRGLRKTSFDVKSEVRRPSLAKFNSVSMIEAPITRVINILIAIKESGPTFLAPTLEKAIDILKNSEIFLPQFQSIKPEDQITSELVSSLINSNKSGVRRMSHEAASNKSSLSLANPSTPTVTQPSLTNVPANVQALLDHELSWNFNVIELERITNKRPLTWLGLSLLNRFNVCTVLQCSETTVRNWLSVIESNYHENPYHNSTHAADVMQATAYFLMSKRINAALDPMDQIISLIAAIIHDVDHPGRNSAFLCNSSHQLAILYNDISVLESHHAARAFLLTVGPGCDSVNIFKNLGSDLYRDVRQSVIDMVLATDMTKHFEHLAKFMNVFQTGLSDSETFLESESDTLAVQPAHNSEPNDLTPENIVLIKRMLIKCADVSNPARPLRLCQTWAERISAEYCDQTDEEKKLGLKVVMPTFDRATCSIPKSQIGFIDYFANDMFEAWHSFGDFPETVENMNINYQYWKDQQAIIERKKQQKLSLEANKVSETEEEAEESAF